jgi:MFS family permease
MSSEKGLSINDPLIGGKDELDSVPESSDALYRNFILMCCAFACNHGCVVSCLAYASSELGDTLGGYGSGTLYVFYALTALLFSKPVTSILGPKNGLLVGMGGYCIYVGAFLVAVLTGGSVIGWIVFLFSAAVGGISGGILWTAQGKYFSKSSQLYAQATSEEVTNVNARFAAIFATAYLGFEMVTKGISTLLFLFTEHADAVVFSVYSVLAVSACLVMVRLSDLGEKSQFESFAALDSSLIIKNIYQPTKLVYNDTRLALMIPFQLAFGFTSSYVPFYVFGTIISDSDELGDDYVGGLAAFIVLVGAVIAVPAGWLGQRYGKEPLMIIGGLAFTLLGLIPLLESDSRIGTWSVIFFYLGLQGLGRGTWENTNKAVIADLFAGSPDDATAAFAAVSFSSGMAGAIGFFSYPTTPRDGICTLVVVFSLFAIACYIYLVKVHLKQINK